MAVTPENGGTTAYLPNTSSSLCETIKFSMDGIEVEDWDKSKVSVKYAGETVPFSSYAHMEPWEDDDLAEYYGWSYRPAPDYDGVLVCVNYQVFKTAGVLEIELEEGAFTTTDGDLSPSYSYTHTYTGGEAPEVKTEIAVKSCKPAAESVVKSISKVTLCFDIAKLGDNMVLCDESKAYEITLTKAGSTEAIGATAVAYDETVYVEETMPYSIIFPETTEAGEYTVTVPAGFFWAAPEMGEKPADAVTSEEITVKYTVDPNAKSGIQIYTVLSPVQAPENVASFEAVVIDFSEVEGQINFADEPAVSITKDGQPLEGVTCNLSWNWEYGNMHTAQVTFEKDEDTYVINENGTYELTVGAGSITAGNDQCEEIKATFIVQNEEKHYSWTATPANNGKIEMPSEEDGYTLFTFVINGAETVSYDEWEDPEHDPLYGTTAKAIAVTYNGESVKNVANVAAGGEENIGYSLRDNWEEPEIVIGVSNKVFTKGGVLKITVDEGRCTADDTNPTPAISYTCTVGEVQVVKDYEVKVSPAMDVDTEYTIDYFSDGFKIEFTNAETVVPNMVKDYDDDDNPIWILENEPKLKVGGVVYYGEVNVEEVKDAEHPTFIITYPDMFDIDTSLGGYINFSVDEGTFTVDGEYDSPAISQTWKLKRTKEVDTSYVFGPRGDIVNEGFGLYFMISFNIDEYIALDRSNVTVQFNGEYLPASEYAISVMNGDNKCIYLQFESEKYKNPELTGSVTLIIPDQAVSVSGVKIGAISHTWNIVLPKNFTYKVTGFASKYIAGPTYDWKNPDLTTELPAIADLSEITFEIPDATTAELWNASYINLRSRDYMTYGAHYPEVEKVEGTEHPTFKLKFSDAPSVDGKIYELTLNLGAFYIDNAYSSPNLDFAVNFDKTSGIEGIVADAENGYTVVSVDGRVIFVNGSLEQVKALEKGIYIINGKKVAVK